MCRLWLCASCVQAFVWRETAMEHENYYVKSEEEKLPEEEQYTTCRCHSSDTKLSGVGGRVSALADVLRDYPMVPVVPMYNLTMPATDLHEGVWCETRPPHTLACECSDWLALQPGEPEGRARAAGKLFDARAEAGGGVASAASVVGVGIIICGGCRLAAGARGTSCATRLLGRTSTLLRTEVRSVATGKPCAPDQASLAAASLSFEHLALAPLRLTVFRAVIFGARRTV